MKTALVILFIGMIVLFGMIVVADMRHRSDLHNIVKSKEKIINTDSLARQIEKRVLDSFNVRVAGLKSRLSEDSSKLVKLRIHNEQLDKLYRSISIADRPKY